ncbi:hypothetical protein BKG69_15910 [Mycobacteroides chelonae]|uniref:cytochrome P450 n=1 Tax=Mycobacteroides chelonae TaxID=1774 RepID=UPI0008A8C0E5|nr:cytochrome P450 [Mycobacteroides chelonae]OHT78130.1 hypothetical protein BKG69_15910 [Mycobacteroides chelonae]
MRWQNVPLLIKMLGAFAGKIDDPYVWLRDGGDIYRMPFPNLPQPLKAYIAESFIDGFAGETVIVNSPQLVREFYELPPGQVDHEATKKFVLFTMGAQSPFVSDGTTHVRMRRFLARELTPARVEDYRARSVAVLDDMIDQLPLDTPIALHDFYTRFTQDIILRVVFGWCGTDIDELKAALYEASSHYIAQNGWRLLSFMLHSMITLRRPPADRTLRPDMPYARLGGKGLHLRKGADALIYRKIAELRAHPNDSVASRLIKYAAQEDPAWTDKRLRDIIATMLLAGHDTSVMAYAWTTQYLLHSSGPRARIVAEARAATTDRYAQAANTEALRMQPPVSAVMPYPATTDIAIGGHRIRKNTFIFIPTPAVHYNPEMYPEPEVFRPERWLENKPDRYGFLAFGAGPHRCPGSTFYLTEASIVSHRIFGRLDLEPCLPHVDHAQVVFGSLIRPRGQTDVIIRVRRPAHEVPWYKPESKSTLDPLKAALLVEDSEPTSAHCPSAEDHCPVHVP